MPEKAPKTEAELELKVDDETIERFERDLDSNPDLYGSLFSKNEALALFIRRRAIRLAPDTADRDVMSQVALEVAAVAESQAAINGLERLFAVDAAPNPNDPPQSGQQFRLPPAA